MTFDIFHALLPSSIVMSRPKPPMIWQLNVPSSLLRPRLGRQGWLTCSTAVTVHKETVRIKKYPRYSGVRRGACPEPFTDFQDKISRRTPPDGQRRPKVPRCSLPEAQEAPRASSSTCACVGGARPRAYTSSRPARLQKPGQAGAPCPNVARPRCRH